MLMENNIKYVENKCYGCKKRQIGCHGKCEDYKSYKKYLEEIKKKEIVNTIIKQYNCDKHEDFLRRNKDLRGRN